MANPYREMLSTPGVMGLVLSSFIVRLPQAMIGIGIITMLAEQRGHYWLAGSVAATFTLANALSGPYVSRLVDRHGQSRVLPIVTAFSIIMLLALLIVAYMNLSASFLFVFSALAGIMPNMPAMIRARWTELFRGVPQLHTAFSLDTVLTELSYIIGPVLAIALSTSIFAEAGLLAAALLLITGMTAFLLQRQTEPRVVYI
ncbi:MFS transporter [Serratia sp. CY37345]|uniref:MFS transporter n=1 Tax=Serratia sp. CY37345 TaxID=3383610 RepID=UPI003FA11FC2